MSYAQYGIFSISDYDIITYLNVTHILNTHAEIKRVNHEIYWYLQRYINKTITSFDIIHRPVFYLKHMINIVPTSQQTHYVSTTIPTA
jgi:hypothetical protein